MQGHLFTKQVNKKNASHLLLYVPRQSKLSRLIRYISMGLFLLEGIALVSCGLISYYSSQNFNGKEHLGIIFFFKDTD